MSTGEFRAIPDASASTAQFRAFAEENADKGKGWQGAPGRSVVKMALIVVGAAVVLAAVAFAVLG
jgi:hypothetical protein